jgi:hypothetical protein
VNNISKASQEYQMHKTTPESKVIDRDNNETTTPRKYNNNKNKLTKQQENKST